MTDAPFLIGIAGGTGAGKTTIATEIATATEADITLLSLDNYYEDNDDLPRAERADQNYDHPDAIDWDLLVDHLERIAAGESVTVPEYDFERHTRTGAGDRLDPGPIVVLEGIFALYHEAVRANLDLAIYVQTDADVRVLRRLQRDISDRGRSVEGVVDQYLSTVKPMHEQFVEPTKRDADVIIPEGSKPGAIDLLRERVKRELETQDRAAELEETA